MWSGRFFKQVPYTLIPPCLPPLARCFSALSSTSSKARHPWTPHSAAATARTFSFSTESFALPYLSVRIHCRKDIADMLSEALLCFGASSTSVDEEERCGSADELCITSIFPKCQDVDVCISRAADSISLEEIPNYEVEKGEQSDWIKETQESFHPVEVTKGLWIVPEWRTPPDVKATNIILNPRLAFGTGEHPTTKLCLLLLRGSIKGGELFLDYGTGSGILAIAALKFGAALSVGLDVDPQAITSASQNAALNNIEPEKMQLHLVSSEVSPHSIDKRTNEVEVQSSCGTGVISEKENYDVVIANILLNPLLDLADDIVSYAKPGAVVGVSGILSEQLPYILDRYSQFLEGISVSESDDWACVSGTKKKKNSNQQLGRLSASLNPWAEA